MSEVRIENRLFERLAFEILESERMSEKEHHAFFRGAKKMFEAIRIELGATKETTSILNSGLIPDCPWYRLEEPACVIPNEIKCPRCHGLGCYHIRYARKQSAVHGAERANCSPEAGPTNKPQHETALKND